MGIRNEGKKRVLCMIIAAVLLLVLSLSALWEAEAEDNLLFSIDNGSITIDGCKQGVTELVIPDEIDGYTVTSIGAKAFQGNTALVSVVLPDTIDRIEMYAFYECTSLKCIVMPQEMSYIGYQAFRGCSDLEKISIPEGIEFLDEVMFAGCTQLKEIDLPNTLKQLGMGVFAGCENIESIDLPDSITYMDGSVFSSCSNMKHLKLPSALENIDDYTFRGCISLEELVIPASVCYIGPDAFYECEGVVLVVSPDSYAKSYAEAAGIPYIIEEQSNSVGNEDNYEYSIEEELSQDFSVGSTVLFGRNIYSSQAIEWIVMSNDGDTATLLSKQSVGRVPYHNVGGAVTWEHCSLREWLNGSFLNDSFSDEEKSLIQTTVSRADGNAYFHTDSGNDTVDKVFILSAVEAEAFLSARSENEKTFNGEWWLRTTGRDTYRAACVLSDGYIDLLGYVVEDDSKTVRPAIRINVQEHYIYDDNASSTSSIHQSIQEGTREEILESLGSFKTNELINVAEVSISEEADSQRLRIIFEDEVYAGGSEGYWADWLTTSGAASEAFTDLDGDGEEEYVIVYLISEEISEYDYSYWNNNWNVAIYEPHGNELKLACEFPIMLSWWGERFIKLLPAESGVDIMVADINYWDGGGGGVSATLYSYDGEHPSIDMIMNATVEGSSYIAFGPFDINNEQQIIDALSSAEYDSSGLLENNLEQGENCLFYWYNYDEEQGAYIWDDENDRELINPDAFIGYNMIAQEGEKYGIKADYSIEQYIDDDYSYEYYTLGLKGGETTLLWASEGWDEFTYQDYIDIVLHYVERPIIGQYSDDNPYSSAHEIGNVESESTNTSNEKAESPTEVIDLIEYIGDTSIDEQLEEDLNTVGCEISFGNSSYLEPGIDGFYINNNLEGKYSVNGCFIGMDFDEATDHLIAEGWIVDREVGTEDGSAGFTDFYKPYSDRSWWKIEYDEEEYISERFLDWKLIKQRDSEEGYDQYIVLENMLFLRVEYEDGRKVSIIDISRI